jgi:hypothetical protein
MQRIDAFFKGSAELRSIAGQAEMLVDLQKIWNSVVPEPMRKFTRTGRLEHRSITVFADNGAVAAKLKLLAPTLLKNLQIKGVDVTSIRVEVQVQSARPEPLKTPRNLSLDAAASLTQLAETLPESPLREAIERLAKKG